MLGSTENAGNGHKITLMELSLYTPGGSDWRIQVWSWGREDSLEKGMATHSSILAWTEEPGGLQSWTQHND